MPILCPACKKELNWGGSLRYQTLGEHVSNPNRESPERSFYYCDNIKCGASAPVESRSRLVLSEKAKKTDPNSVCVFWDADGDLYGRDDGIKFIEA